MDHPPVVLEPFPTRLPALLDGESETEHLAAGFGCDFAERFRRPASCQEVIDDDQPQTRGENSPGDLDPVLDTFRGRRNLTSERIASTSPEVLLGIHHRDVEGRGRSQSWGDAGCFRGEDELGFGPGEGSGQFPADRFNYLRFDTMVEKLVDENQVPFDSSPFRDGCSQIHERDRSRKVVTA